MLHVGGIELADYQTGAERLPVRVWEHCEGGLAWRCRSGLRDDWRR